MAYSVHLNEVPHGPTYDSEQSARRAVREMFGACDLSDSDSNVMFWPSVSARGHVMVEIKPASRQAYWRCRARCPCGASCTSRADAFPRRDASRASRCGAFQGYHP